ncbi:MAG TPA: DUF998 domain-containing protein [bacterium]|nr:DUF998 domain-containing protein [bacterium]
MEAKIHAIVRDLLLFSGILSSLLYVTTTILGAMSWESYSSTSQTVSELFAIEAPSRSLAVSLLSPYIPLIAAFALGIWISAGRNRILHIVAALMFGYAVVNFAGSFFPMHLIGVVNSMALTDRMHILITAVTVILMLALVYLGAYAFGKGFRLYSFGTLLVVVVFGAMAGYGGTRMASHLPTPWLGVAERINIFSFMLWISVLAFEILTTKNGRRI